MMCLMQMMTVGQWDRRVQVCEAGEKSSSCNHFVGGDTYFLAELIVKGGHCWQL